ncbi:MAG: 6-bladed beta-propeller [Dysgonamonadaceae bacterium]|jgi:hypothetical protein|nr:6-bladed beta-propeller [Dysgonamonadaceae bacterium]
MITIKNNDFLMMSFIILLFLLTGCRLGSEKEDFSVIDLSKGIEKVEILNLSDFANSISYIKMNTSDESVFGEIFRILYEDDMFMVSDTRRNYLYIFNKDGSFKQKAGNIGQGPEEYTYLAWFDYLHGTDEILLHDLYSGTYFYNLDGSFKRKINLSQEYVLSENNPAFPGNLFRVIYVDPTTYAVDVNYSGTPLSKLMFLNDSLQVVLDIPGSSLFEFDYGELGAILHDGFFTPEANVILYRHNNRVVHYNPDRDSICIVDKDLNQKYMRFVYGDYKKDGFDKKRSIKLLNMQEYSNILFLDFNAPGLTPEPYEGYSSYNGVFAPLNFINGIFNKTTGELTFLKQAQKGKLGFKNDIDAGLPFWPKYITTQGEMVTYYRADEFMEAFQNREDTSEEVKAILKDLKEDDNPVIAIAKLKKR